jgi:hypothetical protein
MASNTELEDLILGAVEVFATTQGQSFSLGFLSDESFKLEIDPNIVKANVALAGKGTVKAWNGGTVPKMTLTLASTHKEKLRLLMSSCLEQKAGETGNLTDGQSGTMIITGNVGKVVKPIVLTAYVWHEDCVSGDKYVSNNLNPLAFQLTRAISTDALELDFSSDNPLNIPLVFEGMADFDINPNGTAYGYIGYVNRPYFGLHILNTGSGFTTPVLAYGTPFVASAVAVQNDLITVATRIYRVISGGTMSATAPVHTTGSVANGGATLQYLGTHPVYAIGVSGTKLVPEMTVLTTASTGTVPSDLKVTITGGTGAVARLIF